MRTSTLDRTTKETTIKLELNIDGTGKNDIFTEIGFFDHMLTQISKHGFFDMFINVNGDTEVDCHHIVEDVGMVFGDAITDALGEKESIKRYGSAIVPMDDALVLCAVDISGRPYLCFEGTFTVQKLGTMDSEMVEDFFRAVSVHGDMNIHIKVLHGKNNHHIAEAMFKAFAKALDEAVTVDPRIEGVLSTKGVL